MLTVIASACRSVPSNNQVSGRPTNSQLQSSAAATEISVVDLFRAYQENRGNADRAYKGNNLVVSGSIFGVQKLAMHGSNAALIHLGDGKPMVTCAVVNAADDLIDKLKRGDQIRFTGHCDGLLAGSVALHDCKIDPR
jgi:hypothetical protein